MRIFVVDGQGALQEVIWQSAATPVDRSGVILDELLPQVLMPANADRSGWLVQCVDPLGGALYVNDVGEDASSDVADGSGSVTLGSGQMFPPPGYPVTVGPISVVGPTGATFVAREW